MGEDHIRRKTFLLPLQHSIPTRLTAEGLALKLLCKRVHTWCVPPCQLVAACFHTWKATNISLPHGHHSVAQRCKVRRNMHKLSGKVLVNKQDVHGLNVLS